MSGRQDSLWFSLGGNGSFGMFLCLAFPLHRLSHLAMIWLCLSSTSCFPVERVSFVRHRLLQGWASHECAGCSSWTVVLVTLTGLFFSEGVFVFSCSLSAVPGLTPFLGRCVAVVEYCTVRVCSGIQGFPDKVLCCFHRWFHFPVCFTVARAVCFVFEVPFFSKLGELRWGELRATVTDQTFRATIPCKVWCM